jgi:hypothetical protein
LTRWLGEVANAACVALTFHDLRATGVGGAWRRSPPHQAARRAFPTTELYPREAENLREGFGEVFPALPPELTGTRLAQVAPPSCRLTGKYGWQRGIEPDQAVETAAIRVSSRMDDPTRVDVSARELVAFGPGKSHVESALARAIESAVLAGRWDVVAQLAKELEARRLAAAGVRLLADEQAKREPTK